MKKLISVFLVLILLLSGCSTNYKEVDLSDIEDMVVYTEDPILRYADENRAIIYFNGFGVIVFDINEKTVTDRISAENLFKLLNGEYPNVTASLDGNIIYIGTDDLMDQDPHYAYEYNIDKGKLSKINKSVSEVDTALIISSEGFEQYFEDGYSNSYVVAETEDSFVYLRLVGGEVKTLQLVICPYDAYKNTVIDIFK